jgi:site-specific DNA recombinase
VYVCHSGSHVMVPYDDLNNYAEAVLLAYLARDDIAHQLTATPIDPQAVAAAEAAVKAIEQERDDLADQLGSGSSTARAMLARALPKIEARLAEAKARRDDLTAPSRLRGLIKPGKDVRRRWVSVPIPARREIARLVFVPDLIGELRVTKGPLRDPITSRVQWRRDADEHN